MQKIVFYSWQSQLPNSTNRSFILDALSTAASEIIADDTIGIEPVIDRDTLGVAGAPDIASTIFAKISAADIFVADISIILRSADGGATPNPNVLIELGYAINALGHERLVLVFNEAFGTIAELPFDLRTRRLLPYKVANNETEKAAKKSELTNKFKEAIVAALQHTPEQVNDETDPPSRIAIEEQKSNRVILLRRDLDKIFQELTDLKPKSHQEGGAVEDLLTAINKSEELVARVSKILSIATILSDKEVLLEVYKWFGKLFELYALPKGFNGTYGLGDFDFFKFVGHELLTTMVALLIKEGRLPLLGEILEEQIPIAYLDREGGPGVVEYDYASIPTFLLPTESKVRGRVSLHADIIKERHTSGGLGTLVPLEDFTAAEFFLYLHSHTGHSEYRRWYLASIIWMNRMPMFLISATKKASAHKICTALGLSNVEELRNLLTELLPDLQRYYGFSSMGLRMQPEEIAKIGTL
ncbi:MAG: hypothetical protein WBB68_04235 [Candidatus Moraniibacteriota bacterium]